MKCTILPKLSNETFQFLGLYYNTFAKDDQKIMSKERCTIFSHSPSLVCLKISQF